MPARRPISDNPSLRWCHKCQGFQSRINFYRNCQASDGLSAYCKTHTSQVGKTAYHANPDAARQRNYKSEYKMGMDDYQALHQAQEGRCAICKQQPTGMFKGQPRRLCVDHCHLSGRVRGLLCFHCNAGIGSLREDTKIMEAAIAYVHQHNP